MLLKYFFLTLIYLPSINANLLIDLAGKFVQSLNIPLDSPQDEQIFQEALLEATQFIIAHGYPAENHTVETKDGYILTMHRIPFGKKNTKIGKRQPVLVIHGIAVSSQLFTDSGAPSLAFYLADHGYDVWLGNLRGNFYTRHIKYKRDDKKFWDFCWDEMAEFDIPAMIDYVLKETKFNKIPYIAHSMGTTVGFAFFSTKIDYHEKISGYIALSPITTLQYSSTLVRSLAPLNRLAGVILHLLGLYTFPSLDPPFYKLQEKLCPYRDPILCSMGIDLPGGYSYDVRNTSRDFLYLNHATAGASVRSLQHFAQTITKKGMYKFDFGYVKNFMKYHSFFPPKYPLSKVKIPVALFHSANDAFADPIDVTVLSKKLPNVLGTELVGPTMMNHDDMTYAVDAKSIYQDKMLTYLKKIQS